MPRLYGELSKAGLDTAAALRIRGIAHRADPGHEALLRQRAAAALT